MLLATIISWLVIRMRTRASRVLDYLAFIPYAIPGLTVGVGLMVFFLSFPNPFYGTLLVIILAYLTNFLPIGTRFSHAGMVQLRAELEEAAATSGAGLLSTMRRVIIPLLLPSLVGGGLFIFLLSAKVMATAAILWNADTIVLPVLVFRLWETQGIPLTSALSVIMILGLVAVTFLGRVLIQQRTHVVEA